MVLQIFIMVINMVEYNFELNWHFFILGVHDL